MNEGTQLAPLTLRNRLQAPSFYFAATGLDKDAGPWRKRSSQNRGDKGVGFKVQGNDKQNI